MALEEAELLDLRIQWLKDILEVHKMDNPGVKTIVGADLRKKIRGLEADKIGLTDKEAAEAYRQLDPEW
jgi:hypothetical protein